MLALSRKHPRKRAFITGAASGLGAALSRQLAADGWTIGISDMRPEPLQETAKAVDAAGGKALSYTLDVTDRDAYARTVTQFLSDAGGVDVVVNNAGVAGAGRVGAYSLEDWDWLLQTNLMGPVHGCHFFTPHLVAQKSGHVINIASAAAIFPVPGMAAYCAAKAAVRMLSEVLYNEVVDTGVGVSVVMPEFFQTNLADRARGPDAARARPMLEKARYTADQVASVVLAEAGAGELHITFPKHTRALWWVNRLAPMLTNKFIRTEERRRAGKR